MVYIFKLLIAATIAKELDDEISIFDVLSLSVKEYKGDIDEEVIYKMCMAVPDIVVKA
jgi:ATP-dependent protease Clp ATPase subunit